MKKYTMEDATKDDLIEYFFNSISGGFRIPAAEDQFLLWLQRKRSGILLESYETATEAAQKALQEYVRLVHEFIDEPDIDKKIALHEEADRQYERYQKFSKQGSDLNDELFKEVQE